MTNYLTIDGYQINAEQITIPIAKQIAYLITEMCLPYLQIVEIKKSEEKEIIIFDTEVEIAQRCKNDIRSIERIAIVFSPIGHTFPEVLAMRSDFPKVPHLNLKENELPRSLCLYEEDYSEFMLHWTPIAFIERIRQWLSLTSKGKLHQTQQPLEPFFTSNYYIILPPNLNFEQTDRNLFTVSSLKENPNFLKCHPISNKDNINFIGVVFKTEALEHGIIYKQPRNLKELHDFMNLANADLLKELRILLIRWLNDKPFDSVYGTRLALFVVLPKKRQAGGSVEIHDIWVFLSNDTIAEIGAQLGIWEVSSGIPGLLLKPDTSKDGTELQLLIAKPIFDYSIAFARELSDVKSPNVKIALIGTGALGSQMFLNLMRMGFGEWTLIDKDFLLPHNIIRHALHSVYIGSNKADSLANFSNSMLEYEKIAESIPINVLDNNLTEEVLQPLKNSEVIVDMSTNIAVARHLVHDIKSTARRISLFMNPSGYDLVALSEDKNRNVTLDYVEMQYYRKIINNTDIFQDHLQNAGSIRYSNSCRDVSNQIPQDIIALQSAICSRALQSIIQNKEGSIQVWRTDPESFKVDYYHFELEKPIVHKFKEWLLYADDWIIRKIYELRSGKLPNETGGILIGSFDMERKIVYVIDTIPSPPDSKEWPNLYIRGFQGLQNKIFEYQQLTGKQIEYVGEWHSHPAGFGCNPSGDDRRAFSWLTEVMAIEAKPAIMLIAGDHSKYAWYVGVI